MHQKLSKDYQQYREARIQHRRFNLADILPILQELKERPKFTLEVIGKSVEQRDLHMISAGKGNTQVLLWSQMHGDEPTATMALLDIFQFLDRDPLAEKLLKELSLHFIPMLNPDGTERYSRRNAAGIDLNRDALALRFPESQALKSVRDQLRADFCFNLHDQSIHYTVGHTSKPATISFLAPAYNYKKEVNLVRNNAMQLIGLMNEMLQEFIPQQVAKYNDDFEPRAFGDNMQRWGTSTILIESGGLANDPEKQQIRKLNYLAILTALFAIANKSYQSVELKCYNQIPENEKLLFDLLIKNVSMISNTGSYTVDLGINHQEINERQGFYYHGNIEDMGDLSIYHGYHEIDASGMEYQPGKVYSETLQDLNQVRSLDVKTLLGQGFTTVRINKLIDQKQLKGIPFNVLPHEKKMVYDLKVDNNPTFVLLNEQEVKYAIINGFVYDLSKDENQVTNSLLH